MSSHPPWRVVVSPSAQKELRRLHPDQRSNILRALSSLADDPWRGDVRKLRGAETEWRLRVGDLRVRFEIDFETRVVQVLHVLPRSDASRD